MDRIERVLLIMPFLPIVDLMSTLLALSFGGEEVGILARPILENYGAYGLVILAVSASIMFLVFMQVVIRIKKLLIKESRFRWMWHVLAVPIYWIFLLEAMYVSTVALNFIGPLSFRLTETIILRAVFVGAYFGLVSALTIPEIRQLPRF